MKVCSPVLEAGIQDKRQEELLLASALSPDSRQALLNFSPECAVSLGPLLAVPCYGRAR